MDLLAHSSAIEIDGILKDFSPHPAVRAHETDIYIEDSIVANIPLGFVAEVASPLVGRSADYRADLAASRRAFSFTWVEQQCPISQWYRSLHSCEQKTDAYGSQSGSDKSRLRSFGSNVWPQCTQVLTLVLVAMSVRVRAMALNRCWFRSTANDRHLTKHMACNSK